MNINNGLVQGAVRLPEMADKTRKPSNEKPGPRKNQTILSQCLDEEEMRRK
jgi:hypothetical protein